MIPYVKSHEQPKVHNMIERVTRSVVHCEFWHYESLRQLVVDYMRAEWHGEHVIQLLADRVGWSLHRRCF